MRVLALDLGTRTGWAVTPSESGVWRFPSIKGAHPGNRLLQFERTIRDYVRVSDLVVYEKVMGHGKGGTAAAHLYGAFEGFLFATCAVDDTPVRSCHVGTLKKHATGNGRASKEEMIIAAQDAFGMKVQDDNHADALWLLDWARAP